MLHVSVKPEILFYISNFPITNSYLATILTLLIFFILAYNYNSAKLSGKQNTLTTLLDFVQEQLYTYMKGITKSYVTILYPLLGSYFFFIIISNYLGLLPGFGSITFKPEIKAEHSAIEQIQLEPKTNENSLPFLSEFFKTKEDTDISEQKNQNHETVHLLRGPTADLNTTIALALISVFIIQYYGIKINGAKNYAKKFFNTSSAMMFILGLFELMSEFIRIISFSFRLFGNIFAGEVILMVIAFLIPYFASFPFLLFEFFVGFIQAFVFTTLSAIFIMQAIETQHH